MSAIVPTERAGGDPLLARVFRHALMRPEQTCIIDGHESLSYRQLWCWAQAIAAAVEKISADPTSPVGIFLPSSAAAVASMYGCLLAGRPFVPIPFLDPETRTRQVVDDSHAALVLCEDERRAHGRRWVNPLQVRPAGGAPSAPIPLDPATLAYIIYTSGSTGVPKGVAISRGSLFNAATETARAFAFHDGTRALCISPFHFDGSFGSVFGVPFAGGALVIAKGGTLLPRELASMCSGHGITHLTFSPSYLRLALDELTGQSESLRSVQTLGLGGEDCSAADLRRLATALPGLRVFNRYGPSEATIAVTSFEVDAQALRSRPKIPLGNPHAGVELRAVGVDGQQVGAGEVGELLIGGVQLMAGYWRDPELTKQVMVQQEGRRFYRTGDLVEVTDDQQYVFVGRNDSVVNRQGVRIALAEVARALCSVPGVDDAVCIGVGPPPGTKIAAFVVSGRQEPAIRAELRRHLPLQMAPDNITALRAFPLTSSLKVDLAALRATLRQESG